VKSSCVLLCSLTFQLSSFPEAGGNESDGKEV
jgi:hypothetical protein